MNRILIQNGTVVEAASVVKGGHVLVADGRIVSHGPWAPDPGVEAERVDASGLYVLPGLIDLHSDAIEREVEPRPNTLFPPAIAVREMERRLAGHGITTMYHSVSIAAQEFGPRSHEVALAIIHTIHELRESALIRTRVHLRYEITDRSGLGLVRDLLQRGFVQLLSFMDHTPGQGQYRDAREYREYLVRVYGIPDAQFEQLLSAKLAAHGAEGRDEVAGLAASAQSAGVPLASHDDDTPDKLREMRRWGVAISEFPMSLAAARHAAEAGMAVCVGAPNVVRDGSTGKNLRAADAIDAGVAHILCSDYYPAALLHAVFRLAEGPLGLARAVAMASLAPARAVGLARDLGSIEAGKEADLILVRNLDGLPVVVAAMVAGRWVYRTGYGRLDAARNGVRRDAAPRRGRRTFGDDAITAR
jgi:alpha-D-ribose 1-methylphosphonate 5-triphosphate diphosphatase